MPTGRPDYTGSIIIEDIELVSAIITVTGAVTVTGTVAISGPVTVTGAVSVTGTVAISGTVTIAGAVTVTSGNITVSGTVAISGTVTIAGAVTITSGTVSISGSVTVTGTVAISGSVTITGSVTATISGTPDINISGSSVVLTTDLAIGYRPGMIEADTQYSVASAQTTTAHPYGACTSGVDAVSFSVSNAVQTTYTVAAIIFTTAGWSGNYTITRDGTTIKTGSATSGGMTIVSYEDVDVLMGSHTYAIQFDTTDEVNVALIAVDENNAKSSGSVVSGDTDGYWSVSAETTTGPSSNITLAEEGYVRVLIMGWQVSGIATSVILKRDSTTLQTSSLPMFSEAFSVLEYNDGPLAAGTYNYNLTLSAARNHTLGMVLISPAGPLKEYYITPYLQNLNVGLDTRLPKATTPAIYNITMTDADTEYSQALPSNCKKFLIQTRDGTAFRFAYETGKVATPTEPYLTVPANSIYYEDFIEEDSQTLYFACDSAGKIIEIVAWS